MDLNLQDLRFYLIPGEGAVPEYRAIYEEAYRMWKDVWATTLKELDGAGTLYADDFTRQSLHAAIFHKDECIALTAFHFVDFNVPTGSEDSYFKAWTPEALITLTNEGKEVLICSHLTVSKGWRKASGGGMPLPILIGGLSVNYFMTTNYPVMTGTMRCNRGAHTVAYAVGGTPILKGAMMHGVEVDLVGFYRSKILADPLPNHTWLHKLWNERVEIPRRSLIAPIRKAG